MIKTGDAAKTGDAKTGGVVKPGGAARTGGPAKAGGIAKTGGIAKSGGAARTGGVAKTGSTRSGEGSARGGAGRDRAPRGRAGRGPSDPAASEGRTGSSARNNAKDRAAAGPVAAGFPAADPATADPATADPATAGAATGNFSADGSPAPGGPAPDSPAASGSAPGGSRAAEVVDGRIIQDRVSNDTVGAGKIIRRAVVSGKLIEDDISEDAANDSMSLARGEIVVLSGQVVPSSPGGTQVAVAGAAGADDLDPAVPELEIPEFVLAAGRAAADWAHRRAFGLTSACGIWIATAVCAATWFSAGTRSGNFRAVLVLWAGYAVLVTGYLLSRPAGAEVAEPGLAIERSAGSGLAMEPDVAIGAPPGLRRATTADVRTPGPVRWLAALGTCLAESIVYAGLALGAVAERWPDVWPLAMAVLGFSAVRNLMSACSTPPGFSEEPDGALRRLCAAIVTMPVGGRMLLVGVVAPIWGSRAALLALLDWAIISVGYGLAGRAVPGMTAGSADDQASDAAGRSGAARATAASDAAAAAELVRLRDDGVLARGLGSLVRGGLLPLPPAVLGLAVIAALALVGLHSLAGALTIGPAIVMLLAAPGSGHPHTGRFDWLVPVFLLAAQLLYLSATGHEAGVPDPVTFALLVALLLRYCDLAFPLRPVLLARARPGGDGPAERGTALGWEGRLLFAGLGAAIGIGTVAYLALTAYLGVLICAKVVTSCLAPREENRR